MLEIVMYTLAISPLSVHSLGKSDTSVSSVVTWTIPDGYIVSATVFLYLLFKFFL